jgi:hypothetical protein
MFRRWLTILLLFAFASKLLAAEEAPAVFEKKRHLRAWRIRS